MEQIRQSMIFSGRVQGVGFRYRAKYAADGCGVTGWVHNEWDGTVSMEAQGTMEQINHMLTILNQSDYIIIDDLQREEIALEEHEYGFHIR